MSSRKALVFLSLTACLGLAACDEGEGGDAPELGGDTALDEEGDEASQAEAGDTEPDSDEDGLSDAEEAELGTDPNDKDSDDDNYWDSWEVLEGTDPLDLDSRIYTGWWPYNPDKDSLEQGSWDAVSREAGAPFPRASFYDRSGDLVDLYDFTNFTINSTGQPAYFIFDISAQWCGPCHAMAYWLGGLESESTAGLREAYPTLPDKVHGLQAWWVTFIVEGGDKNPPDMQDAEAWFSVHPDAYIPIFVDLEQIVQANFSGGYYPFVFLLDPELKIVSWDNDSQNGNPYYAFDFVEHEL